MTAGPKRGQAGQSKQPKQTVQPKPPKPGNRPSEQRQAEETAQRNGRSLLRSIVEAPGLVVLLAVVASLAIGSILIIAADEQVHETAGYFFSRPGDFFAAIGDALSRTFSAIFEGSIFRSDAATVAAKFEPITRTLTMATPLIFAGLGLGLGFRAGLFNIGAQGQMIMGAMLGGYLGFAWQLPPVLHLVVAVLGCAIGGALWGLIPGILKARTGAHEVITTIMLNYIALNLIRYALGEDAFQRPGSDFPKSPLVHSTAEYPALLNWLPDANYRLHLGFVVALLAAWGVWWLMERSTWGFQFRAVGSNPDAARTAGMSVPRVYILVMVIAGGLAGLAGSAQVLGTEKALDDGIAGSFGFDAITVALLGRSRPGGIIAAAVLFGALRASGSALQVQAGLPDDIVLVIQSLIVLFIAAPALVRFLFRLPEPSNVREVTA